VNVGERYKSVTFTTYPHESKGPVNVVNVVRGYFGMSRTWHAKFERRSLILWRCLREARSDDLGTRSLRFRGPAGAKARFSSGLSGTSELVP
jgi:hypothetical protein